MPDHSLLTWDLTVKAMIDDDMLHTHAPSSKHYRKIPDNFLESDEARKKFEVLNFRLSESGSFRELDSIYGDFCDAIESQLIVKDLSFSRKKHKLWWNPSLTELRKVARQSRSKWKSKKSDVQLKFNYLAAQKNFDQEVSRAKRAFHNAQHDKLVKSLKQNPKEFWRLIQDLSLHSNKKKKGLPNKILNSKGNLVSDTQSVLNVWKNYYRNLLNPTDKSDAPSQDCNESPVDPSCTIHLL